MTANGFIDIEGVFDPESDEPKQLRMERERLDWLRTRAPAWITNSMPLVQLVLCDPVLVYDGPCTVDEPGGRVYVGFPKHRYDNDNRRHPACETEAFCVFHSADGTVFEWRWIDYENGMT